MLAAVVPAVTAGAALAADSPAGPAQSATTTSYADAVAIGTAVKIAAPGVVADKKVVKAVEQDTPATEPTTQATTAATTAATDEATDESTVTATPSDAEVIETDSRQNASEDPTEVAVLGTKISSNQLASTGPSRLTNQVLLALALVGAGLALRFGPGLTTAAVSRRH